MSSFEVRHESPSQRKTEPFTSYLKYLDREVTKNELILMLSSSLESDRVCQKHSHEMLLGVLKLMGTRGLHMVWPDVWELIDDDCDMFMQRVWAAAFVKNTSRAVWIVAHRQALAPILDVAVARELDTTPDNKTRDASKLKLLFQSKIGASLFKQEGLDFQFQDFLISVKRRFHDAEMQDFTSATIADYTAAMQVSTKQLIASGHAPWKKKRLEAVSELVFVPFVFTIRCFCFNPHHVG